MTTRSLIPTPPARPMPVRCSGVVKWWDAHKRIGFIEPDGDDGDALFFHAADVKPFTPAPPFNAGDVVTYLPGRSMGNPRAFDVALTQEG